MPCKRLHLRMLVAHAGCHQSTAKVLAFVSCACLTAILCWRSSRAAVAVRASLAATEASQRAAAYSSAASNAASKAAVSAER